MHDEFDKILGVGRGRSWTPEKNELLRQYVGVPHLSKTLELLSEAPDNEETARHISTLVQWLSGIGKTAYQSEMMQVLERLRLYQRHCEYVVRGHDDVLHVVLEDNVLCNAKLISPHSVLRGSYTDERFLKCPTCRLRSDEHNISELREDYQLTGFSKYGSREWETLTFPLLLQAVKEGIAYGDEERLLESARAAFGKTRHRALVTELLARQEELDWMVLQEYGLIYQRNLQNGLWKRSRLWSWGRTNEIARILLPSVPQDMTLRINKARAHLTMAMRLHNMH